MANLITERHLGHIARNRFLRSLGVISVLMAIVGVIGILSLGPALIIAGEEHEAITAEIAVLTAAFEERGEQIGVSAISDTREQAQYAEKIASRGEALSEALRVMLQKTGDVRIVSFSYARKSGPSSMVIAGTAGSREALASYVEMLRSSGRFKLIDVPIAIVAKSGGDFSITVTGNF